MSAKYQVGQRVRVEHHMGCWEGTITYRALTGDSSSNFSGWEYEVSNAPRDRLAEYPNQPLYPGNRWHPLLWEEEIVEVLS